MTLDRSIGDRIFESISKAPGCRMHDLNGPLPDLTWNQVFRQVNQLRLRHRLLMISNGQGSFVVGPTS
jgi:hypothetical protein